MKVILSLIIPVYKTEKYLERCLDSIVHNTYKNLEIICVNDGSTDNSRKILAEYEKKDSRIIIIDIENQGVSKARNIGLRNATGEYIAFVDSDDWIHTHCFEILLKNAGDEDIIAGQYVKVSDYVADKEIGSFEKIYINSPEESFFCEHIRKYVCGRIYRRNIIKNLYFPDNIKLGEDTIYNVVLMSNSLDLKVLLINFPLYYYFDRNNSAVHVLPASVYLEKAEWYIQNCEGIKRSDFFLIETLQTILIYRYMGYVLKDLMVLNSSYNILKKCRRKLFFEKKLDKGKKMKYFFVSLLPIVMYRNICVFRDPTLISWEQLIKEKYKDVKRGVKCL